MAGTIVGVVDRARVIDGSTIEPGDVVFALPSSGLHTNGYSLARSIFFEEMGADVNDRIDVLGCTVGEELLKVHRSYLHPVTEMQSLVKVKGLAHITGGGVLENLPRVLPSGCSARIEKGTWTVPPVFKLLAERGQVDEAEMFRVFNMGIGMLVVVPAADAGRLSGMENVHRVGGIVAGDRTVTLV